MRSVKGTAYSRITLALDIIRKLDTGYHELNIIKQKINLCDEITIFDSDETTLKCNFDDIPTDKNNISIMALDFIKEKGLSVYEGPFQPNPTIKFFYVLDPNGLKIQFVENI